MVLENVGDSVLPSELNEGTESMLGHDVFKLLSDGMPQAARAEALGKLLHSSFRLIENRKITPGGLLEILDAHIEENTPKKEV